MDIDKYINEHKTYDELYLVTESVDSITTNAYYDWLDNKRISDQKYLFENVNIQSLYESANEGFFAKIGKTVINLMEKVQKFFSDIMNRVKDFTGLGKKEHEKASAYLAKNPQYSNKIIAALNSGQLTISDVAKFENDATKLIELFQADKIDENSFKAKFKKNIDKFNESGKMLITTAGTVVGLLTLFPKIVDACGTVKKSMTTTQRTLKKFNNDIDRKSINDPSKARVIMSALGEMVGLQSKAYNERTTLLSRVSKGLRKFNMETLANKVEKQDKTNLENDKKKMKGIIKAHEDKKKAIETNKTKRILDDKEREEREKEEALKKKEEEQGTQQQARNEAKNTK